MIWFDITIFDHKDGFSARITKAGKNSIVTVYEASRDNPYRAIIAALNGANLQWTPGTYKGRHKKRNRWEDCGITFSPRTYEHNRELENLILLNQGKAMKTITIHDDGSVTSDQELTSDEKLNVGSFLFGQVETDNDHQYIFYTDIYESFE